MAMRVRDICYTHTHTGAESGAEDFFLSEV